MVVTHGLGVALQIFVFDSLAYLPKFSRCFFEYKSVVASEEDIMEPSECEKRMRYCEIVCVWGHYMIWDNVSAFAILGAIQPSASFMLTTLSDDPGVVLYIFSVITWAYLFCQYGSTSSLCFQYAFTWFSSTISILSKLQDMDYLKSQVGNMKEVIQTYRIIQLQTEDFMRCFGTSVAGAKTCLTLFACASTYGAIRLNGAASLTFFLIGSSSTGILFLLLSVYAGLNASSESFLENLTVLMGQHPEIGLRNGWVRKAAKCSRLLKIRILNFYMVDKLNVLEVISYIADNVVFLLVEY